MKRTVQLPADGPARRTIGRLALVAGIVQPLTTVPQIIAVYGHRSATDVSLATWAGYLAFGLVLLAYGLAYRLKPIWVGQMVWVLMQAAMVVGIVIYHRA